ncbi:uncharacterized protein PV09_00619 [Verruconis gallopava]|uniref:Uncharacterized protein n=1 Tax=Verruconis gallopava TaxID=253628 RepID=A0A0D1Y0R3_9PEZI|nr:uncharacterized protein PV09_00619 [Verruconis gallopava]KIW08666.1 hypothetical protein PV09_00619 [Verruconis gallopava]
MLMSNVGPAGLNFPGVEEEIRKYYREPPVPKDAGLWTERTIEVFFACDALKEVQEAIATV